MGRYTNTMSATDTKETPVCNAAIALAACNNGEVNWQVLAELLDQDNQRKEEQLTAVTAQRDRALGLLERAMDLIQHGPTCICGYQGFYQCTCDHNKLLAEYEALRKGER